MTSTSVEVTVIVPLDKLDTVAFTRDTAEHALYPQLSMDDRVVYVVDAGTRRVSLDRRTWKTVTISDQPHEQVIDLRTK